MLLPLLKLDDLVRAAVDYLVSQQFMFTCYDITRQLTHQLGQKVNHDDVRQAVEDYLFGVGKSPANGHSVKPEFRYQNRTTNAISGFPQVYMPLGKSVNDYNKDFLDPARVEPPKETLKQKLGKAFQAGESEDEIVKLFKAHIGEMPVNKPSVGAVYVLQDKNTKEYLGRRGRTKELKLARVWPSKNGPTQAKRHRNGFEVTMLNICEAT